MGRDASDHRPLRAVPSSLVGHATPLERPLASDRFDYEGELAVVIGRFGRRIPREHALEHVAGYSCFNDGSIRDYQRHTSQFTAGKNFDRSGSFGPWLVTADEVDPAAGLRLRSRASRSRVAIDFSQPHEGGPSFRKCLVLRIDCEQRAAGFFDLVR